MQLPLFPNCRNSFFLCHCCRRVAYFLPSIGGKRKFSERREIRRRTSAGVMEIYLFPFETSDAVSKDISRFYFALSCASPFYFQCCFVITYLATIIKDERIYQDNFFYRVISFHAGSLVLMENRKKRKYPIFVLVLSWKFGLEVGGFPKWFSNSHLSKIQKKNHFVEKHSFKMEVIMFFDDMNVEFFFLQCRIVLRLKEENPLTPDNPNFKLREIRKPSSLSSQFSGGDRTC